MQLSERQQNTIAVALTILSAVVIGAAVLGVFWLLASFVGAFSNVFLPLALAAVAALVFQPYYEWFRIRLGLPVPLALAGLFLSVLIPVGVFASFFGVVLYDQVVGFLRDEVPKISNWAVTAITEVIQALDTSGEEASESAAPLGEAIRNSIQGQGGILLAGLQAFATTAVAAGTSIVHWTGGMLSWVVTPVYFVFFLMADRKDVSHLADYLPFLKAETRKDVVFLVQEFVNIVVAFFRGQLIIAFLQGVLYAIGFSLVGLKYGMALGFMLGFLNVIPYLGSMVGLGVTLPLSYFQENGGLALLIWVLVVIGLVQLVEGYLLTPKIMGNRTGLHPMAIIVAVFFWGAALGGILGMILAIPLTAFLVVFWRLAKEKYIPELV